MFGKIRKLKKCHAEIVEYGKTQLREEFIKFCGKEARKAYEMGYEDGINKDKRPERTEELIKDFY